MWWQLEGRDDEAPLPAAGGTRPHEGQEESQPQPGPASSRHPAGIRCVRASETNKLLVLRSFLFLFLVGSLLPVLGGTSRFNHRK